MNRNEFFYELASFPCEFLTRFTSKYNSKDYFIINLASYGDYDNSCHVERANHRFLLNNFSDFVSSVPMAYNAELAVIHTCTIESLDWTSDRVQNRAAELIDILNGLCDYPCIDDELASQIEMELQDEAWENVYRGELIRALQRKFEKYEDAEINDNLLRELFNQTARELNIYWEIQAGGNAYINFMQIVESFDEESFQSAVLQ